jgi:hypothetical protein
MFIIPSGRTNDSFSGRGEDDGAWRPASDIRVIGIPAVTTRMFFATPELSSHVV